MDLGAGQRATIVFRVHAEHFAYSTVTSSSSPARPISR
ncbi:hypothetical protein [Saccharothrix texasensis]